jgi:hypothetical protein
MPAMNDATGLYAQVFTAVGAAIMLEPDDEIVRLWRLLNDGTNVRVSLERTDGYFEAEIGDRTLVISRKLLDLPDAGSTSD